MLDRVRRAIAAAEYQPSVTAGRIRCSIPPRPPDGSRPNWTANNRIRMKPSQKVGVDCPTVANQRVNLSIQLPRRNAEITPIGMAIRIASNIEEIGRANV